MDFEVISRQTVIPPFDRNAVAVNHIEYYPSCYGIYDGDKITPQLISKILKEVPEGIEIYLSFNSNGECGWMEVLSDGEWLALRCYFYRNGKDEYFATYNPDYASTAIQIEDTDYSDMRIWTLLESSRLCPVPKIQAITDMETGVEAVEYFIRTGELYPGIDWAYYPR